MCMLSGGQSACVCYQVGSLHVHVTRWAVCMCVLPGGQSACVCYQVGSLHGFKSMMVNAILDGKLRLQPWPFTMNPLTPDP